MLADKAELALGLAFVKLKRDLKEARPMLPPMNAESYPNMADPMDAQNASR
jgi:hypothetical protein